MSKRSGVCQPLLALLFLNSVPLSAQQLTTTPIKTASGVDFTPQLDFEMRHDEQITSLAKRCSSCLSIVKQILETPNANVDKFLDSASASSTFLHHSLQNICQL